MEMSLKQYIDNPMGKRNAVFSQRDMYKKLYTEKFNMIFLREAGKIDFTLYTDKNKDKYIIHIKVPSETVKDFYYDVVFLFYSNDAAVKSSSSLQDYSVKFFSNDPAFVFTYMRVFLKNDLLFEDLKTKCPKLALTADPKERNPYQVPGYSKIVYFAYLFIQSKNLFSKSFYNEYGEKYSSKKLLQNIEHSDDKISKRQELGKEVEKQNKKESNKPKKDNTTSRTKIDNGKNVVYSKRSKSVSNTKTSSKVKRSSTSNITKKSK